MSKVRSAAAAVAALAVGTAGMVVATPVMAADAPAIVINEVESNGGVPGDWVEFLNVGDVSVDLSGFVFKDNQDTNVYTLPSGSTIAPGAYLVIDEVVAGAGDFGFGLGGNDAARLFMPDGTTLVDSYAWTSHAPVTYGRCPNGTGDFTPLPTATKGTANDCGAANVVINEVESNLGDPGDWVELKNTGTIAADVSGWVFRDDNDTRGYTIPDGTTIAAGGYLVLEEYHAVNNPSGQFTFGLGAADVARIFDAEGELIDSYAWTSHAVTTYGRCPDGTGDFATTGAPTKGAPNDCTGEEPPVEPDELSTDLTINEVESNGDDTDWVEVMNLTSQDIDISGYQFTDDDNSRAKYVLPAGSVVPAGGLFVIDQAQGLRPGFDFGLGANDAARLYDTTGELVASYWWRTGHAAVTYGRCPDGTGPMQDTTVSTKGAPNDCSLPVRINEIESQDAAAGPDWVELMNVGTASVDAGGLIVRDDDDTRGYTIPAGTVIEPGAFLLIDSLGFGLGGSDEVRLFDTDGVTLLDSYSWTSHATVTYGRCPDGIGSFETTASATPGAPNHCVGLLMPQAWPGGATVQTVDQQDTYAGDLSGVFYEASGSKAPGTLWAVENGNGLLYRIESDADGGWNPAAGWENGRVLRYPDGTGTVDAEGVTLVNGAVYVASERNNAASSISRPSVLRYVVAGSGDLTATHEWNLAADFPGLGANAGLEGVTFVPDSTLVEAGFIDESTEASYQPGDYPGHGDGLFLVAVEGTAAVYAYALMADGTFARVATIGTEAASFAIVADVMWDAERDQLWVVCDEACDGRIAVYELDGGVFTATALYERPAQAANYANEGFAIADSSQCVNGSVPTFYADDNNTDGHSLRMGTLPCADAGDGGDGGSGGDGGDGGNGGDGGSGDGGGPGGGQGAQCSVSAPASATPGQRITLMVDRDCTGPEVEVWMFSEPTFVGTVSVSAQGAAVITVPASIPVGTHTIQVQLADGTVLGSTMIQIVAAIDAPGGLSETGADLRGLALALALLSAGALLVARRRLSA